MVHALVLDQQVRDWVFLPLTLAIVLMKLLTQYMHQVRAGLSAQGGLVGMFCSSRACCGARMHYAAAL